jgi:GTP-binding protein EngB required for normal cell division
VSRGRAGCCARIVALCDEAEERLAEEDTRAAVRLVRAHLAEPLRVAVAGRVKSGKSTLVNALLRHKVAPTAYGECTRAVTWFRFGYPPQASLVFRDGGTRRLPLEQGQRLPAALGADPADLARVDVELSSAALEGMTVIDTPGLESANTEYSAATRRALAVGVGLRPGIDEDGADVSIRTEEAAGKADAMVFVLTGAARRDEIEVLESFRAHLGGLRASAVNTLVVLNKADLVGDDDGADPLSHASALAERYAERLGPLAAAVIPTVGLIAESLEAGIFGEMHAASLRGLAAEQPGTRARLLDNIDWFLDTPAAASRRERQELLDVLGLHGVRLCIEFIDGGRTSVAALREELSRLTGIDRLRDFLADLFARRADVLKAATALADLERIAAEAPETDAAWLKRAVERTRLDPAMRALATTWAFARVAARGTDLPADLAADLRRVALAGGVADMLGLPDDSPAEALQRAAATASARWRRFANECARSDQEHVADVMCQQYAALWQLAAEPVKETA